MRIKSKSLEKYLLGKYGVKSLEELDYSLIEELFINRIRENGEISDYDFKDFEKFPNLKYISLQNFKINNFETNELGRCKSLSAIQFCNCRISSKSRLKGNIKVVSFNNCKKLNLKYLGLLRNLEVLKIINVKKVNLKYSQYFIKNIEKLYIENTKIYYIYKISKLKNLVFLQLIKCKFNRSSLKLLSKNIQIEELK